MKLAFLSILCVFLACSSVRTQCLLECCQSLATRERMEFNFYQDSGRFTGGKGESAIETITYSGANEGRNNPDMQCVSNVGVLPVNTYILGYCKDTMHDGTATRPCSFYLEPQDESTMCGRNDFFIHGCYCCTAGDSTIPPTAGCSAGCIIMNVENRQKLRVGDIVNVIRNDPLYDNFINEYHEIEKIHE